MYIYICIDSYHYAFLNVACWFQVDFIKGVLNPNFRLFSFEQNKK